MADDTTPAEVVETTEAKPAEPKKPVLDSNKPLAQQTKELLAQLPEEKVDDAKSEDESPEKSKEPTEKEDEAESPAAEKAESKEPVQEDDDSDDDYAADNVEPVELPSWQQYILDNLPTIQTIGHVGENGKDRVFQVKRLEDLPENFEFASRRDELAFSAALASQEVNARDLLNQYRQQEQQQQLQAFQNQEAIDIQKDITALQREGVLPKFKYSEDDPQFNDDPAVKTANEIYDLYKKTNDSYLREFQNTGRTYRITYRDAADKYFARQARQAPARKEEAVDTKAERTKVAAKVSAPQSASPDSRQRPLPAGATMQDVMRMYKLGRI